MTMTCDDALNLLNAKLDGELPPDDRARLDAHVAACAACQSAADALLAQDAELRSAFAPRRRVARALADRVLVELPAPPRRQWRFTTWLPMLASAAAGFAIAWALFHNPPQPPPPPQIAMPASRPAVTQPAPPIARLTLATGAVACRSANQADWSPLPTGAEVPADTCLKTGPGVRCEFRTADGSEIRLNENTELTLRSPRRFELASGEAWSSVAHVSPEAPEPFEALAASVTFTALGTQFDLDVKPDVRPPAVTLLVQEGDVRVSPAGNQNAFVCPTGQQVDVVDGKLGDRRPIADLARANRWVNEILVMKGRDDPEVRRRVDDLFARIGQEKMDYMYEEEIRSLGDHCVIPLARYIESDRSATQPAKRAIAAKIIAQVAPPWAIGELVRLLRDDEGDVRFYAATALRRLTGQSFGRSPEQWRDDSLMACAPSADQWAKWWESNKSRYPGVPSATDRQPPSVAKERQTFQKG